MKKILAAVVPLVIFFTGNNAHGMHRPAGAPQGTLEQLNQEADTAIEATFVKDFSPVNDTKDKAMKGYPRFLSTSFSTECARAYDRIKSDPAFEGVKGAWFDAAKLIQQKQGVGKPDEIRTLYKAIVFAVVAANPNSYLIANPYYKSSTNYKQLSIEKFNKYVDNVKKYK